MRIEAKLARLPLKVRDQFKGMTIDQQVAAIKEYEEKMDKDKHQLIQKFVTDQQRKGCSHRQIRKMVLKKFKVVII